MEFISVEKLIKILKEKNIDFGKGDPYNRLRYYTKIGWIPHMTRKKNEDGIIMGHYPIETIDQIEKIEKLKKEGLSNEEIKKLIEEKIQKQNILKLFFEKIKNVNLNLILVSIVILGAIYEINKNNYHNEKTTVLPIQENNKVLPEKRIVDSGISFIPKLQNKIFIATGNATSTSIILLNFYQNLGYNNNYFISEIKENQGFYVETSYPVANESKFNWIIIK